MSEEDKLEIEKKKLEEQYEVEVHIVKKQQERIKVLSNMIEGDPDDPEDGGLLGALFYAFTKSEKDDEQNE